MKFVHFVHAALMVTTGVTAMSIENNATDGDMIGRQAVYESVGCALFSN